MTECVRRTYYAGALVRGQVRRALERITFDHPEARYKELRGFMDSTFLVEAPASAIEPIDRWMRER